MVFIKARDGNGAYDQPAFELPDGAKRVSIGKRGVLPVQMLLDPEASPIPGPLTGNDKDLIYIAAGRDGLWMMEADTTTTVVNRVWRIDDSGNQDPAEQQSLRWCSDIGFMKVNGVDYLAAIFGKMGGSRLRLYRLESLRDLPSQAGNSETGYELAPSKQVNLTTNPAAVPAIPEPTFGGSVSINLDVDQYGTTSGDEEADVYVAMGHHGLVRVRFPNQIQNPSVAWGPVFGDGTSYHQSLGALYGNVIYEAERAYLHPQLGEGVVHRIERPFFADVAVFRGTADAQSVAQLYVAVDNLHWLMLDLNQPWGSSMPIAHHEGKTVVVPSDPTNDKGGLHDTWGKMARAWTGERPSCTSQLKIIRHPVLGDFLVASTGPLFLTGLGLIRSEGVTYHADFSYGGGDITFHQTPAEMFWYPIHATYDPQTDYHWSGRALHLGGSFLDAPSTQGISSRLTILHGLHVYKDPLTDIISGAGICLVHVEDVRDTDDTPQFYTRSFSHGHGRRTFSLTSSLRNNSLVLPAGNDSGVPDDGFLFTRQEAGEWIFDNRWYVKPANPPWDDERGPNGLLLDSDTDGQWLASTDQQYLFCGGTNKAANPPLPSIHRWRLSLLTVPADLEAASPTVDGDWYVKPPKDRYDSDGRLYYMGVTTSLEFDAFLGSQHSERFAFATWGRTPESLVVIDRVELVNYLTGKPTADYRLGDPGVTITFHRITSNPEFNRMPRGDLDAQAFWKSGDSEGGENGLVRSWTPKMVKVKDPVTGVFDKWVMVAPCGSVQANPEWDVFDGGLDPPVHVWAPPVGTIWLDLFSHGMVQFFEFAPAGGTGAYEPVTVYDYGLNGVDDGGVYDQPGTDDVPGNSPLSKIIPEDTVGDANGNIWRVETLSMPVNGVDKVFLFSCDVGGRVYVHEIQDILQETDPNKSVSDELLLTRWLTPPAQFDELPNAAFDIAIDYRGGSAATVYVAVRRVGVVILNFDPAATVGQELVQVGRIQTGDHASAVHLRINPNGTRHLVVSDYGGGIRLYGEELP